MKLDSQKGRSLQALGVATLYLFGSRAQGVAREDSDYDFGILLKNPSVLKTGSQTLYQKIFELLEDTVRGLKTLDIVFLDRAPLQLRYHVIRVGIPLLDADPIRRGRFEERTLLEHADFEPYRRLFEEATLARIS